MTLHLTEKDAAAFFAQIKRPMPASEAGPVVDPIAPAAAPEKPQKAARKVQSPAPRRSPSYAAGYASTAIRAVRPQWWLAAMVLGYLVIRAILETPTF